MQSTMDDVQEETIDQLQLHQAQFKSTGDWIHLAEEAFELNAVFTSHSILFSSKARRTQELNIELDSLHGLLPGLVTNKLRESHGHGRTSSLLAVEREVIVDSRTDLFFSCLMPNDLLRRFSVIITYLGTSVFSLFGNFHSVFMSGTWRKA